MAQQSAVLDTIGMRLFSLERYPKCGNHVILEQFTLPRAIQIVHIGERDQYHCIPITTPEHFIIQDSEGCTWILVGDQDIDTGDRTHTQD
jgi:hypothetical protein